MIYDIFFIVYSILEFYIYTYQVCTWLRIVTYINTSYPWFIIIKRTSILRIHSLILCNRKEILSGNIKTELLEWTSLPQILKVVAKLHILQAEIASIFDINVRN